MKTAISIQPDLFEQAEDLARELAISRSRLFVLALEAYIQQYQNQRLLEQVNAAYDEPPDPAEEARLRTMRRHQRRLVEAEW